ncbi:MAG: hypothetical protein ABSH52_03625, partial [Terriglobia bacterium]
MESEHEAEAVTVEQSTKEFLQDAEARNLRASTVYKYRLLFAQIKAFALDAGFRFLNEFDLSNLRRFRATVSAAAKKGSIMAVEGGAGVGVTLRTLVTRRSAIEAHGGVL